MYDGAQKVKMTSLESKKAIFIKKAGNCLRQHLSKFTVVVTAHDGTQVIDHGSGTLLMINGTPIVVTAAHVIKNYPENEIHIVGNTTPSDRRIAPIKKEFWGGNPGESLDVGYLVLPHDSIDYFGNESFATLDRIDLYPESLSTDMTVFIGMPEVLHDRPAKQHERFQPFMYVAGIDDDTDWSRTGNRQLELTMEYPKIVPDAMTGTDVIMHIPPGMSGGGIWRSYINRQEKSLWTAEQSKLIAVGTEWDESTGTIKLIRIEAAMHLLSLRFPSIDGII